MLPLKKRVPVPVFVSVAVDPDPEMVPNIASVLPIDPTVKGCVPKFMFPEPESEPILNPLALTALMSTPVPVELLIMVRFWALVVGVLPLIKLMAPGELAVLVMTADPREAAVLLKLIVPVFVIEVVPDEDKLLKLMVPVFVIEFVPDEDELLKLTVPPEFCMKAVPAEDVLLKFKVPLLLVILTPLVIVLADESVSVPPKLMLNVCEFVELLTIPALLSVNVPGLDMVNAYGSAPELKRTCPTVAALLMVTNWFAAVFIKTPASLVPAGGIPPIQLLPVFQIVPGAPAAPAAPFHCLSTANPCSM